MNVLISAACLIAVFLAALAVELAGMRTARRGIPVRVAVTGTRGKSSVTRLIAAALRETGAVVLAKTTGSKPVLIGPDGTETEIARPGSATILEQKSVLRAAARAEAGILVAEMMSIRPECLKAEAGLILKPGILAITNARLDHRPEMGKTGDEIAESLAAAIRPGMTVFVAASEYRRAFGRAAEKTGARLVLVPAAGAEGAASPGLSPPREFPDNIRLAAAVADFLGVAGDLAAAGMAKAVPDFGALKVWRLKNPPGGFAASAFAANEPDSTRKALARLEASATDFPRKRIGILNLRLDREDRTAQWLDAAAAGFFAGFAGIVVTGEQAPAAARRLGKLVGAGTRVAGAPGRDPGRIMDAAAILAGDAAVFLGLGNIGGAGTMLVEYWSQTGESV